MKRWISFGNDKNRRGMLTKGVVLLQDNARPPQSGSHKCFNQALLLGDFRPPSFQSWPGTKMKVWSATQRFHANEELMNWVKTWLHNLATPFYDEGLQKLVSRYDKCLNVDGNYVEK
jgi:hypothetical protein